MWYSTHEEQMPNFLLANKIDMYKTYDDIKVFYEFYLDYSLLRLFG